MILGMVPASPREALVNSFAAVLDKHLLANSGEGDQTIYSESKFVQLLGAHWWRRQLKGSCDVVAVSPGLIPQTGIARHGSVKLSMDMPDAKSVPEGELSSCWHGQLYALQAVPPRLQDTAVHTLTIKCARRSPEPPQSIHSE